MAEEKQVLINESTLKNMANTIRDKQGLPSTETTLVRTDTETVHHTTKTYTLYAHTDNIDDAGVASSTYGKNLDYVTAVTIPNATQLNVDLYYGTENISYDYVIVCAGDKSGMTASSAASMGSPIGGKLGGGNATTFETATFKQFTIDGDTVSFGFRSDSGGNYYGYYAIITAEVAEEWDEVIEVPVYEDIPVNQMLPTEMIAAIAGLEVGGVGTKLVQAKKTLSKNSSTVLIGTPDEITFPCFVFAHGGESTMASSTYYNRYGAIIIYQDSEGNYKIRNIFPASSYDGNTPFTANLGKYTYNPTSGGVYSTPSSTYFIGPSSTNTGLLYNVVYFTEETA